MNEIPRACGMLDVSDDQSIYWEEWGPPDGVPALYLHGSPGGTLGASGYRHRFDLSRTRVIGFDQRGCGRSLPHAAETATSLRSNTMAHLIDDIEALRKARGVEAWDRFASHAQDSGIGFLRGRSRLVEAYAGLMNSPDSATRDAASREWALWEDTHVSIGAGGMVRDPRWQNERFRVAFARLTTHYWAHAGLSKPPLLERMDRLRHIPGFLIHGRRDVSGTAVTAWEAHRRWPGSVLVIDEGDGHGGATMVEHWDQANAQLVALASS